MASPADRIDRLPSIARDELTRQYDEAATLGRGVNYRVVTRGTWRDRSVAIKRLKLDMTEASTYARTISQL
jgi:hypothetical protein